MRVIEFKLKTNSHQKIAIQEAIRVGQFIRNKCLRFWMDSTKEDQVNYATLCKLTTEFLIFLNFLLLVNSTLWLVKQVPKELGSLYPVFMITVKSAPPAPNRIRRADGARRVWRKKAIPNSKSFQGLSSTKLLVGN